MTYGTWQLLWKISLGMASLYGPDVDFYTLGRYPDFWKAVKDDRVLVTSDIMLGVPKTGNRMLLMHFQDEIKLFLENEFRVYNEEDLRNRMEECLQGSKERRVFNARRQRMSAMLQKDRIKMINSLQAGFSEFFQYSFVNQYDRSLPPAGILAFDIANYTCLCRLGAFLGYLTEEEVPKHLHKSAVLAQNSYSSFREFGLSSTVGLLFSKEDNEHAKYIDRLYRTLTHPLSYWNYIEWNLDLSIEGSERKA